MSSETEGDAADGKTFLAKMRHDMRTLLNPILGYSDMMIEDAQEAGEEGLLKIVRRINESGESILARINEAIQKEKVENDPDLNVSEYERVLREAIQADCEIVVSNCNLLEIQPGATDQFLSDTGKIREGVSRLGKLLIEMREFG
jgi:signal transduction histidine kinase